MHGRKACMLHKNPWNGKCRGTDIELYIPYKGKEHPICRGCWARIADLNTEWGPER